MPGPGGSKAAFYQQVDAAFYAEVTNENGGRLPPNLTTDDGKPRKLTLGPQDRAYRAKWNKTAARLRNSKAIPNKPVKSPVVPCPKKKLAATKPVTLPSRKGKLVNVGTVKPAAALSKTSGPASQTSTPAKTKTRKKGEPCKNESLVVTCGHGSRGYKIELPAPGPMYSAELEVIDDGKESITCTTSTTGPCAAVHKGKVFDIYPDGSVTAKSDSALKFRARHDPQLHQSSFSELLRFQPARSAFKYDVSTATCDQPNPLSVTLLVYPQLDWEVDIEVGWSGSGSVSKKDAESLLTEDRKAELTFSPTVRVMVTGKTREYGVEISKELAPVFALANHACTIAEWCWKIARMLGGVEVELIYPSLHFKGNWGWREIKSSAKCGFESEWEFGCSPFFGASLEIEALEFAIKKIPVIGYVVSRLRKAANHVIDIKFTVKVTGQINGTLHRKKPANAAGDTWGQVEGKLEFKAETVAQSKRHHFFVLEWGFGGKIGLSGGISAHIGVGADGDRAYYQGVLQFDGLYIYAVLAGGIGFELGSKPEDDDPYEPVDGPEKGGVSKVGKIDSSGLSGKIAYKDVWTLVEETVWLGGDEKHALFDGWHI